MAVNHIVYNSQSLIDLRADTVTAEDLMTGITAHKADGTIITGTLLEGFPEQYSFYDALQDSNGDAIIDRANYLRDTDGDGILDSSGECILDVYEAAAKGRVIYQRT